MIETIRGMIRIPSVRCISHLGSLLVLVTAHSACDKKEATPEGTDTASSSSADGAVEKALEEEGRAARKFTKDMSKRACEILTPSLVSKTYGVPEGSLKQMKVMGCVYSWNGDEEEVRANLTLLRAHEDEETAKLFFQSATKRQTKEEAEKSLDVIGEKVKERPEVNTDLKKKTSDKMVGVAKAMTSEKGIQYESVSGVGDEARVNLNDGGMWVRVNNLTFSVAAYKGRRQPKTEFKSLNTKDIVTEAKKATEAWNEETFETRKAEATKLAKLIIEHL